MKKNQERRLHRKNAKIVKEGGTPMQLDRPVKPDTTRRCGHCGQMGHMSMFVVLVFLDTVLHRYSETNRKCPKWAEFNSGPNASTPSAPASNPTPTPATPNLPNLGFNRGPPNPFGHPSAVPSPLATSPPMSSSMEDVDAPQTPSGGSAPKIKLTLKRG
jgi:transcription initiation factor TFIID subunit 1, fungi type